MGNSVEGLVYNKEVLKEAGVSTPIKTLTDFYAACEKIKALDKVPLYVNFGAQWPLQQFDKLPLVIEGNNGVYEKMLSQDTPFSAANSSYYKSLKFLKTLIDKKVCVIVNLEPAKLFGTLSEGMVLAAGDSCALLTPDEQGKVGERIQ